jgi:hypothetical protein
MSNIPTAEEYWELFVSHGNRAAQIQDLKDFAQLHLDAQAAAIYKNVTITKDTIERIKNLHPVYKHDITIDKDSILNAYPKENVK